MAFEGGKLLRQWADDRDYVDFLVPGRPRILLLDSEKVPEGFLETLFTGSTCDGLSHGRATAADSFGPPGPKVHILAIGLPGLGRR